MGSEMCIRDRPETVNGDLVSGRADFISEFEIDFSVISNFLHLDYPLMLRSYRSGAQVCFQLKLTGSMSINQPFGIFPFPSLFTVKYALSRSDLGLGPRKIICQR